MLKSRPRRGESAAVHSPCAGSSAKGVSTTTRDDDILHNDASVQGQYGSSGSYHIADGMTVYDVTGDKIGAVSGYTTSADYFKLEKGLLFPRDYYVPMSAVSRLDPDGVYLNVRKDDIKDRGWENPPLGGQQRDESLGDRVRDALDLSRDEPRP